MPDSRLEYCPVCKFKLREHVRLPQYLFRIAQGVIENV